VVAGQFLQLIPSEEGTILATILKLTDKTDNSFRIAMQLGVTPSYFSIKAWILTGENICN
jgi:hypothetical protein